MTQILLVGTDEPLLEGLAQSFAAIGYNAAIARSLADARELAAATPPLVAVVDRALAIGSGATGPMFGISLSPGGAFVLFHASDGATVNIPPTLLRQVLADLTLPLERHRLVALAQFVEDRSRARGRGRPNEATDELRES